jgi:hypothetical protein
MRSVSSSYGLLRLGTPPPRPPPRRPLCAVAIPQCVDARPTARSIARSGTLRRSSDTRAPLVRRLPAACPSLARRCPPLVRRSMPPLIPLLSPPCPSFQARAWWMSVAWLRAVTLSLHLRHGGGRRVPPRAARSSGPLAHGCAVDGASRAAAWLRAAQRAGGVPSRDGRRLAASRRACMSTTMVPSIMLGCTIDLK